MGLNGLPRLVLQTKLDDQILVVIGLQTFIHLLGVGHPAFWVRAWVRGGKW